MKKQTPFLTLLLTIIGLFLVSVGSAQASPLPMIEEKQTSSENTTWYVSTSGDDSNDCLSPSTACANIKGVLEKSSFLAGDTILVEEGEYTEVAEYDRIAHIYQSVNILGGWDANFNQQVGYSIIDGLSTNYGFYIWDGDVIFDSFEIKNTLKGITISSETMLTITNSSFHDNGTEESYGGAVSAFGDAQVIIHNSLFYNNIADSGGAIYTDDASILINGSAVFNNTATYAGGGLYLKFSASMEINNTTISSNSAAYSGGGIRTFGDGNIILRNVTIASNSAEHGGGLVFLTNPATLSNTVIGNNYAQGYGPDCYSSISSPIQSEGYNLIGDTTDCPISDSTGDILDTDPGLAAFNSDFVHPIQAYSPLLDSGNPDAPGSSASACPATDQLGSDRPIDGNRDGTSRCDIGAFESGPLKPSVLSSIEVHAGSLQTANIFTAYPQRLQVVAIDKNGLPIPGVQIDFQAPDHSGPSVLFGYQGPTTYSTVTNVDGIAETPLLYANDLTGRLIVTASTPSLGRTLKFFLKNTASFWYVSIGGDDANDCLSPTTACASITGVLTKDDFSEGDSILVEQGEYAVLEDHYNTVTITQSVNILGGWDSGFNEQIGISSLIGNPSNSGFTITGGNVTLDKFEIFNASRGIDANGAASLMITDSSIHDNGTEDNYGGGLSADSTNDISIFNSLFYNNLSSRGGAIYVFKSKSFRIIDSSIVRNTSTSNAGGLYAWASDVKLINSTIGDNYAEGSAGGIYLSGYYDAIFNNLTITRNSAQSNGGAYISYGSVIMSNSVIGDNSAEWGNTDCDTYAAEFLSGGYNLIEDTTDCEFSATGTDIIGIDPGLAPLTADFVHPIYYGSPLLDAGNPALPGSSTSSCTITDQLGTPRPIDGDGDGDARCDIGAYESPFLEPSILATIEIHSGNNQTANIYDTYPELLAVVAKDNNDLALPGIQIDFQAPDLSTPSVTFGYDGPLQVSAITNQDGIAYTPMMVANEHPGIFYVTASTPSLPSTVDFALENLDGPYWYVSTTGDDSNDCLSPSSACATLIGPLEKATFQAGDPIKVAVGIYTDQDSMWASVLHVNQSTRISGGWSADFTEQIGYSTIDGLGTKRGIYIDAENVILDAFEVTNSVSLVIDGGGIYVAKDKSATILNCLIHHNTAVTNYGLGGGMYIDSGVSILIRDTLIYQNYATEHGGGIRVVNPDSFVIENSAIFENTASSNGGGIYTSYIGKIEITNTTISSNTSETGSGGGVFAHSARDFTLRNVTIAYNSGVTGGAFTAYYGGGLTMANTVVANNLGTASNLDCLTTFDSNIISEGYNLIGDMTNCDITIADGDLTGIDSGLAPLNTDHVHPLNYGSPLIDAGNPTEPDSSPYSCTSNDQLGTPRPIDGDGDGDARCDIGAFESALVEPPPPEYPPGEATPVAPSGTILEFSPTFEWIDVGDATQYQLVISHIMGEFFSNWYDAAAICTEGTCSVIPELILDYGDYSWTVRGKNAAGEGPWSFDMLFTVAIPPFGAPTLIAPSGTITEHYPIYEWIDIGEATEYQFVLNDTGGEIFTTWYDTAVVCSEGICSVPSAIYLEDGDYSWTVRGINAAGEGPWSPEMAFTVATPLPGEVSPIAPSGTITENPPTYEWVEVEYAHEYFIETTDSDGVLRYTHWLLASAYCDASSCAITPLVSPLPYGDYSWTVRGINAAGEGPRSAPLFFTIVPPPPGEVTLIAPSGTITETSPPYEWKDIGDATEYQLVINDSVGEIFSGWYDTTAICDGICSVTPDLTLTNGAYNWTVRGKNATGEGPWSTDMTFTVVAPPPGEISLIAPSGNISEHSPTFEWTDVGNVIDYLLEVTDLVGGDFETIRLKAFLYCDTGLCVATPKLYLPYSDYSWKVRGVNAAGEGPWSSEMFFSVVNPPPGEVTLVAPAGTISENSPTYEWLDVGEATQYQLAIKDSIGGELFSMWYDTSVVCGVGNCAVTPDLPLTNGAYSWTVQGKNAGGEGPWSPDMGFSVDIAVPGMVSLFAPSGTITEQTPTYEWSDVGDATEYQLVINDTAGEIFSSWYDMTVICSSGSCAVTPELTLSNGDYSWTVRGKNATGEGPFSPALAYTVDNLLPGRTSLIAPNGTITEDSPTYSWDDVGNAAWYLLVVKKNGVDVVTWLWKNATEVCTEGVCTVTPNRVLGAGEYTWWVLGKNSSGEGPWSLPGNFTLEGRPDRPTLYAPRGTITEQTPSYSWEDVYSAEEYVLVVKDSAMAVVTWMRVNASDICTAGICEAAPGITLGAGSYSWWVMAKNSYGNGFWSLPGEFTIE